MMVVSNSGPLMALGKLGQVTLLPQLYGQVSLPTAVYTEVVIRGNEQRAPEALLVQNAIQRGQLVGVEVQDTELLPEIATTPLHTGEKQTLHLWHFGKALTSCCLMICRPGKRRRHVV